MVEHLTTDLEIKGSNPIMGWYQEKMTDKKSLIKLALGVVINQADQGFAFFSSNRFC